jgi:DNA-binding MarR family transcriptional regulator
MKHYQKLRRLREHIVLLPGLKSYKDFDISVEIGHHEHIGKPLTLKQLLALDIASEATTRRHLRKLINTGMVKKSVNPDDSRSVVLSLTDKSHELFQDCMDQLTTLLKELV